MDSDSELQKIISQSSFTVSEGAYVYAKVRTLPQNGEHFLVTQDNDEITVVTLAEKLKELDLIERNKDDYTLIALNVSMPFYSVGLLATVSSAIAKQNMDILIVSTYSKDYILVRQDQTKKATKVLTAIGFREVS
ncbi:ACT domain-containing protein [Patescibacteria group bacterium]